MSPKSIAGPLLIGLVALEAGCLGDGLRDSPPSVTTGDASLVHVYEFRGTPRQSPFVSMLLAVTQESRYEATLVANGTWPQARFYWTYSAIVIETSDRSVVRQARGIDSYSTCGRSNGTNWDSCPLTDLVVPDTARTVHGGTLKRGTYSLFAASFGEGYGMASIEVRLEKPAAILGTREGSTRLLRLVPDQLEDGANESKELVTSRVSWNSTGPFYGVFKTAGDTEEWPDFRAVGPSREHSFSHFRQGFLFRNESGALVMEQSFPGAAGAWMVSATRPSREEYRAAEFVGLLPDPGFVSTNGWFEPRGEASWIGRE